MTLSLKFLGLENKSNENIYIEYLEILNELIQKKEYENQSGIILCGSFAKGKLKLGSDIDLVVISNSVSEITINDIELRGIKISIISAKLQTLIKEIELEESKFIRRISHLLSSGIPLTQNEDSIKIISQASKIINSNLPILSKEELLEIQTFIKNNLNLAKDYFSRYDDLAFFTRFSFAIQEAIQIYFKLNKQIIPNWKWVSEYISNQDFSNYLHDFYTSSTKKEKYESFKKILNHLEKLMLNYNNPTK